MNTVLAGFVDERFDDRPAQMHLLVHLGVNLLQFGGVISGHDKVLFRPVGFEVLLDKEIL